VLEERRGGMLRERRGPIHDRIAHVECAPQTEQMVTVAVA
jgi:hypothetical protein